MSRFDDFIPWHQRVVSAAADALGEYFPDPEVLAIRRYYRIQARVCHHIWVAEMREQIALERWKQTLLRWHGKPAA